MVGVDPSIPVDTVHCVPNVLGQQDQITVYYQTGTTSPSAKKNIPPDIYVNCIYILDCKKWSKQTHNVAVLVWKP